MDKEPIRVLLVDDSMLVIVLLTRILSAPGTGIKVVGNARDGEEALRKIPALDPQVICTDLQMPGMNGLELTRNVMAKFPRPILVLSSAVEKGKNDDNIYKLLGAGAIDILPKPQGSLDGNLTEVGKNLIAKIKLLSGVVAFTRKPSQEEKSSIVSPSNLSSLPASRTPVHHSEHNIFIPKATQVIAIGSSTGGPQALQKILSSLSPKLSMPVVCIQHVTEGFTEDLVDWLGASCPLNVRVTKMGETLSAGNVYFPPDTKHLILDPKGRCCTSAVMSAIAVNHRPSITFAFNSIAQYYRSSSVGILLTGMGSDGADGLLNMRKAGGITIAQDEASSVVYGMPKVAAEIGAAQHVLSLANIVNLLKEL